MTHRTSHLVTTALLATLVVATPLSALAAPASAQSTGTATTTATTTSVPLSAPYACSNSATSDLTDITVNAEATATRTSPSQVDLAVSTGKLDLTVENEVKNVRLASSMDLTVDGAPARVSGNSTVTLRPDAQADFPVAIGTATSSAPSLRLVPGHVKIDIGFGLFTVTLNCSPVGTAPTVTVPVTDPNAPTPEPPPKPTPDFRAVKPGLTVKLTKKVQRVGKNPARAVVRVTRPKAATSRPAGTVRIKVGKRTVATRKVTGATKLRVALPKALKPGRHRVVVKFTPSNKSGYRARTVKTRLVVKR